MTQARPLPPLTSIRRNNTHRLIPSKYTPDGSSVLAKIADTEEQLADLFALDQATNDRVWGEHQLLPGIDSRELAFSVPHQHIINASFTHAHPLGSRFNGPERGAWYAGFALRTSQAEVAFHKTVEYAEIGYFEDSVTYDDYLADFHGNFHDLREVAGFAQALDPDSYYHSQELGQRLLDAGSLGVVYPSVRHAGGTCLACFRPAFVGNVRKDKRYQFTWAGSPEPAIICLSTRSAGVGG